MKFGSQRTLLAVVSLLAKVTAEVGPASTRVRNDGCAVVTMLMLILGEDTTLKQSMKRKPIDGLSSNAMRRMRSLGS